MTENKFGDKSKDKRDVFEREKDIEKDKSPQQEQLKLTTQKEQQVKTEQHDSRFRRLSQFLDLLNIPRHHSGHSGSSSSSNNSQQHSPQTPHAASELAAAERRSSNNSNQNNITCDHEGGLIEQEQQQQLLHQGSAKRSSCVSFRSETLLFDLVNGEISDLSERSQINNDDYGTQRIYKKTSANCILTMYLPTREIILSGNSPTILKGIVFVDAKVKQDYQMYTQLTLTFRYGREDEEVMGLRFCNEAIMSMHQIWPRKKEPNKPSLSPLQEALLKRLGEGAHPFTLSLTTQAPPSVQLVPAKRYYGAPIGTSYDVRCLIGNKTDEKFHRRGSVKMGVRVIYLTDVFNDGNNGHENVAALLNNPVSSRPANMACTGTNTSPPTCVQAQESAALTTHFKECQQSATIENIEENPCETRQAANKASKSERGDSFPKLRLSPKSLRFSGRFGRSKSEVDKCPSEAYSNYSKSFQEYDSVCPIGCAGPQGAVDKPFLLQDGRVGLRASLDKSWYMHGEEVRVTVNIRNDSKKTVRKIRVCAIQHVDVCMFNNGKFKNVVADSDNITPPSMDHQVAPGATFNTTVILKPQRGATKNWIALEDTLQRTTEPDEIKANIAVSAVRTPHFLMQASHSPTSETTTVVSPATQTRSTAPANPCNDERNVFAIYVSYYVKVKLTLSSMGGELSLKLPFMLVHINEEQRQLHEMHKFSWQHKLLNKKNANTTKNPFNKINSLQEFSTTVGNNLDRIESVDEGNLSNKESPLHVKGSHKAQAVLKENNKDLPLATSWGNERRHVFKRSETLAQDVEAEERETIENENCKQETKTEQQLEVIASQLTSLLAEEEHIEFSSSNRREITNDSNTLPKEDIQQISEHLDNEELTKSSLAAAGFNDASEGV